MIGTFTTETLYHFRCGGCARWWTIGDAYTFQAVESVKWACPHCGIPQSMKKRGDLDLEPYPPVAFPKPGPPEPPPVDALGRPTGREAWNQYERDRTDKETDG